jgi:phosphoenolpyruvate synthase/pyruvate phosphate dikinase
MSFAIRRATAVLVVPAVEPSLMFFEERLAFTRVAEVPHGDALGFAMLQRDDVEVMLQSVASVADDMGATMHGPVPGRSAVLYIDVTDLDALIVALGDYPIALPRRQTFYGADEIGVIEPGGHLLMFAKPPAH